VKLKTGRPILAIDPGSTAGIALVLPAGRGLAPLLYGAWVVKGSTQRAWLRRATEALDEARSLTPAPWQVLAEKDPPARRMRRGARGAGGDKHGLATVAGMGRYRGYLMALAWRHYPDHEPAQVQVGDWARGLRIPTAKRGDGSHRLAEVRSLLRAPDGYPESVDAAEAALIGCWGALQ
jgi:hypothetical protein